MSGDRVPFIEFKDEDGDRLLIPLNGIMCIRSGTHSHTTDGVEVMYRYGTDSYNETCVLDSFDDIKARITQANKRSFTP